MPYTKDEPQMERPRANGRCGLSEMQSSDGQAPGGRGDRHVAPRPMRYGWSTLDGASGALPLAAPEQAALRPQEPPNGRAPVLSANVPVEGRTTAFELPEDKTIAISIITGPSKGITHQIHKPRISIGGAGAALISKSTTRSSLVCTAPWESAMARSGCVT